MLPPDRHDRWRQTHLGELLRRAMQRFDARVLSEMASDEGLSLVLARLAGHERLTASHIQITRHLPVEGCSLTELAQRAGISKQAMGKLVDQCSAWDLVERAPDARDARRVRVQFTGMGLAWLQAFERGVRRAEADFAAALGTEVATVAKLGLDVYAS